MLAILVTLVYFRFRPQLAYNVIHINLYQSGFFNMHNKV